MTHWWHWGPHDAWELTGSELMWWLEQANRIASREREQADAQRARR